MTFMVMLKNLPEGLDNMGVTVEADEIAVHDGWVALQVVTKTRRTVAAFPQSQCLAVFPAHSEMRERP